MHANRNLVNFILLTVIVTQSCNKQENKEKNGDPDSSIPADDASTGNDGDVDGDADADTESSTWISALIRPKDEHDYQLNSIEDSILTDDNAMVLLATSWGFSDDDNYVESRRYDSIWVVKVKASGAIEWQKKFFGTTPANKGAVYAFSIIQTKDNGFLVSGGMNNRGTFFLKLDENGVIQWKKLIENPDEKCYCMAAAETSDNGFILAGGGNKAGMQQNDICIIRLTSDLEIAWQKTYGTERNEDAKHVFETDDSGFAVFGTAANAYDDWHWASFSIRIDDKGEILWSRYMGDPDYRSINSIWSAVRSGDGWLLGIIVDGSKEQYPGSSAIIKLSEQGRIDWQKNLGASGGEIIYQTPELALTRDQGIIITQNLIWEHDGESDDHSIFISKLSTQGTIEWQKDIKEPAYPGGIHQGDDGALWISASGFIESAEAENEMLLALRLDEHGGIDGDCDLISDFHEGEIRESDIQITEWSDLYDIKVSDTDAVLTDLEVPEADTSAEVEFLCPK